MSYVIELLPEAEFDLRYIYEYMSETLLDTDTAKHFYHRLKTAVTSLSEMPARYSVYEAEPWKSKGIRKMPVGKFLIFYTIKEESCSVHILRILYGGRDLAECLSKDIIYAHEQ